MTGGAAEDAAPGALAPVTRAELLALLNDEISTLREESGRGGWNIWVLAAALVGALHVAGELWATAAIDLHLAARWAVVLGVATYLVLPVLANVHTSRAKPGQLQRTRPAHQEHRRYRWSSAVLLVETIALALLAEYAGSGIAPAVVTWAKALFTLGAVLWAFLFVESFTPLQVPIEAPGEGTSWLLAGVLLAMYYAAVLSVVIGFAAGLQWPPLGASLTEIRLAALGVAVGTILWLLGAHGPPDPRLRDLYELRRRLALGELSDREALRVVQLALRGLDLAGRLELPLARGEHAFRRAVAPYRRATTLLDAIEADLVRAGGGQPGASEGRPGLDEPARRHLRKQLDRATKANKETRRNMRDLARQIAGVRLPLDRALPTLSETDAALVMEWIHPRYEHLVAEAAASQEQLDALGRRLRAAQEAVAQR